MTCKICVSVNVVKLNGDQLLAASQIATAAHRTVGCRNDNYPSFRQSLLQQRRGGNRKIRFSGGQ